MSNRRVLVVNPPNVPFTDLYALIPRQDILQDAALIEDLGYRVLLSADEARGVWTQLVGACRSSQQPTKFLSVPVAPYGIGW